jgi:putative ABC transport system permease protein
MAIPFTYNVRSLIVRRVSVFLTVLVIALVVAALISVMALARGLRTTLVSTGSSTNVIVLRQSSRSEVQSAVTREAYNFLTTLPELARMPDGRPLAAAELVVIVNMPRRFGGTPSNVIVRGVSDVAPALRSQVALVNGTMFRPGVDEAIVSTALAARILGLGIGETAHVAGRPWRVVGLFDAGQTAYGSEIWVDAAQLMGAFRRRDWSSALLRARDVASRDALIARIANERRFGLKAKPESDYYAEQTLGAAPIGWLGLFVSVALAIGACFCCANTMFAFVFARIREVATLRALGFSSMSVLWSFAIESIVLGLVGSLAGCLLALPLHGVNAGGMNYRTFSEVAFAFQITPGMIALGLLLGTSIGFLGGLLPACIAARVPIARALRAI